MKINFYISPSLIIMKKIFLSIILFYLLLTLIVPVLVKGAIVPCSGSDCTISMFFTMLGNIYSFIVWDITTPLAVIALTIGGILMMISAGNPNLMGLGKKILYAAIIGLALVFCSWLIINFILCTALGYVNPTTGTCSWSSL